MTLASLSETAASVGVVGETRTIWSKSGGRDAVGEVRLRFVPEEEPLVRAAGAWLGFAEVEDRLNVHGTSWR
jgi:hypothetical protein